MNTKYWIYRGLQGLFALAMGGSAIGKVLHAAPLVENMNHLQYPQYLLTILGVAYLMGLVALFQPVVGFLREWAYAGFVIALVGAILSHFYVGDPITGYLVPIVLLGMILGAYALEKQGQSISGKLA